MAGLDALGSFAGITQAAVSGREPQRRPGQDAASGQSAGSALCDVLPATAVRIFPVRSPNGLRLLLERQDFWTLRGVFSPLSRAHEKPLLAGFVRSRLGLVLGICAVVVFMSANAARDAHFLGNRDHLHPAFVPHRKSDVEICHDRSAHHRRSKFFALP